jgi:hypothetical protein
MRKHGDGSGGENMGSCYKNLLRFLKHRGEYNLQQLRCGSVVQMR